MDKKFNMNGMDELNDLMYYLDCQELFGVIVKSFKKSLGNSVLPFGATSRISQKKLDEFKELLVELPDTFSVVNEDGQNLGMIACEYGVEEIALLALNNKEASLQQDDMGGKYWHVCGYLWIRKCRFKST